MPRKHRNRRRSMRGGFLEGISDTFSGWTSSLSQSTSGLWEKTKNAASGVTGSTTTPSPQPPMTTSTYGGRRRRSRRRMRGGFKDNEPASSLALNASSISDMNKTILSGGKTRRNKRSRKHRTHRKY